jgi:molybdenum cofactor cytidylyltransferase
MDKKANNPAVIILAAGSSERMGIPKHQLRFSEDETFLEHIIKVYKRFVVSELVVVMNSEAEIGKFAYLETVKFVLNQNPEFGRFHSIRLGLYELPDQNVFVQNVDNPFANAGLLIKLQHGLNFHNFAVPTYENRGGHPILLSSKIINKLKTDFEKNMNFKEVLKSFDRKEVPVTDPYISVNINTPEAYQKYFSRIG